MSERKLHIVHTESSCGWGGQEIRVLSEMRGIQERGHRVTLVTPPEARIATVARDMGLTVVTLPITRKRLPALWALWQWLRRESAAPSTLLINLQQGLTIPYFFLNAFLFVVFLYLIHI